MDIEYLLWLQGIRESSSSLVQTLFDFMGSSVALVAAFVLPCVMYWCLDKASGVLSFMSYGYSWLINQCIKNTVCWYRPWVRDVRVIPAEGATSAATGYSFPSGHTQSASSMLVGLGWAWRNRKRWPLVASVAFTVFVGFSRNFLGVHAPQDVVAGFAEGLIMILVVERMLVWVEQGDGRDARVLGLSVVVTAVFLVYTTFKPYPIDFVGTDLLVDPAEMLIDCYKAAGGFLGIVGGWFCERRYVRFSTDGVSLRTGALRLVLGLASIGVLYVPIGHALVGVLGAYTGQFVRHLLAFLVAMAGVPAVFMRIEERMGASSVAAGER